MASRGVFRTMPNIYDGAFSHQSLSFCSKALFFPPLTPHCAIMEISNFSESSLLFSPVLVFKYYVYSTREDSNLSTELLKANICKAKNIENEISKNDPKITLRHNLNSLD